MKSRLLAAVCAVVMTLAPMAPVHAQEAQVDEIVVTGSRVVRQDYSAVSPVSPPYVQVVRRADNLVVLVRVLCDTRDEALRTRELRETLAAMARAAQGSPEIELGVSANGLITRFDATMLDRLIQPDSDRDDVSQVVIVVKTPIAANDTFDGATARVRDFVKAIHGVGRTEVLIYGDWQLTVRGPDRYRPDIIAAISADAKKAADAFGPGYAVEVEGLENRVGWLQSGPLDLSLYIPYRLAVTPRGT